MTALPIWIALGAAFLVAFFSALQMALREASPGKLHALAGKRGASARVRAIIDALEEHALAMAFLRMLASAALVGAVIAEFAQYNQGSTLSVQGFIGALAVAAVIHYVVGDVIPASIAEHAGDKLVHRCAALISLTHLVLSPVLKALRILDVIIRRLLGAREVSEAEEIEQELMSVVSEGEHEGTLGESERDMIEAVVEFRSTAIESIMTPRTEIEGLEITDDIEAIKTFIEDSGHSRIPVYEDDLDHIVGILYAKDLIKYLGRDLEKFELRKILRKPFFVPETKPVDSLLDQLRAEKVHLAIVLDEYGGVAGLVTIEDVLEEIVGEIEDEYEPQDSCAPTISVIEDQRLVEADGRAYIDDVNDALESIGVELPEGEEYDTVGGFVLNELGHIPEVGESFRRNGYLVTVLDAEPTKVTRVRVEFRDELEGAPDEPAAAK